jgi:ferrous iron transport protein A
MSTNTPATLDQAAIGEVLLVREVLAPPGAPEWAAWLAEIGCLPDERVTVLARFRPGGDPLVARIGLSTFALRRAEAACIHVVAPELVRP